jgi:hypothetical protein
MLIPMALAVTKNAHARVMLCTATQSDISCLLATSALPKPQRILPNSASFQDLYEIADEYNKLPTSGQVAEKISAERNEKRVYHTEYKKAENSAAKEDANSSQNEDEYRSQTIEDIL